MNKVITINLNGNAYQLEEVGFDALRAYLDSAGRRLEGNPDRDEIIADIEQAIADKFRNLLGAAKTVIVAKEVADIIAEMGPVEDASGSPRPEAGPQPASAQEAPRPAAAAGVPKRLYKIHQGAMVGGVCNGIAAYLNIDVTIVRIVFALLCFAYGSGVLIYFLMMFILPSATTSAERAEAHGAASATAQDFIRRAQAGYYEGMKTFGDRRARREWKRKFKDEMRGWKREFRWNDRWSSPPVPAGGWMSHSAACTFLTIITILGVWAIISLCTSGYVFGISFRGIPVWLGIILIIFIWKLVKMPFKAMRGDYHYYGYGHGCSNPFRFLWCALIWAAVIYFVIWMCGGHVGGLHEIGAHLPPKLHHAAQSLRDWWDQQ
jgi:phage shock protein PspC (stress-responsive transcriptional regulator)